MRIDFRLPTLFRATTKRSQSERRVYCSKALRVEVPELSRAETDVAFRLRNRIGEHVVLAHEGRLFRPLVSLERDRDEVIRQLGLAFSVLPNGIFRMTPGSEMTRPDLTLAISPVPFAIEYHYHRTSLLRGRRAQLEWPEAGTTLQVADEDINLEDSVWENTRNAVDFDRLADRLETTNHDDLVAADRMHAKQASRLVFVDGEPWYETRPPCVKLVPGEGDSRYHVGFFPDWLDHWMDAQYVGFGDIGELPIGKTPGALSDGVRYDVAMPELLAFDTVEFAARRTAAALSIWCVERLNDVRFPNRRERAEIDGIAEKAVAWNELLGEGDDVAEDVAAALDIWTDMGMPISHHEWQFLETTDVERSARWAMERERDKPISLALGTVMPRFQAGT